EAAYERAMKLGYSKPEIYRNLGLVENKLGKYSEALAYLHKALDMNPEYADAYFQLADALRKSGKTDEAADATRKFQTLNAAALDKKQRQTKGQSLYEQGSTLLERDQIPQAYNAFKAAAETFPELDAAFYRLAQIEYLRGNLSDAIAHIRHALALNGF